MFCNQCGHKNADDSKFCSNCGKKIENSIFYSSPQDVGKETQQPNQKSIELWNPNASANWSLIFTPIFGSYLQMVNWQTLGKTSEAATAKKWIFYTIGFYLFIGLVIPFIVKDPVQLRQLPQSLGIIYLLIWYFSFSRKQTKYVKDNLNNNYQKKPWIYPLLISIIVLFASLALLIVMNVSVIQYLKSQDYYNIDDQYSTVVPQPPVHYQTSPNETLMESTPAYNNQSEQKNNVQPHSDPFTKQPHSDPFTKQPHSDPFTKQPHSDPFAKQPVQQNQIEMDSNYNQQEQKSFTPNQEGLNTAHYRAILSVHPDLVAIANSREFDDWINNQSADWKSYYNYVINEGDSTQVIKMLNDYKDGKNH